MPELQGGVVQEPNYVVMHGCWSIHIRPLLLRTHSVQTLSGCDTAARQEPRVRNRRDLEDIGFDPLVLVALQRIPNEDLRHLQV